jgi:hypothetical protein
MGRRIPEGTGAVVVADLWVEDYVGGAELTTEALLQSSPYKIHKIKSADLTLEDIEEGASLHWIFGNFARMRGDLLPAIESRLSYSVLEYDYKYCIFRSPEKHRAAKGVQCNCAEGFGKRIAQFFARAQNLFWMSEGQRQTYRDAFGPLPEGKDLVLSSVFSPDSLELMRRLRGNEEPRAGWIVLGSDSWVKGAEDAIAWCKARGEEAQIIWNLSHEETLERMSRAEGFVYLPRGKDTCPRMVIEARLLGCKLVINRNVQHAPEEWFAGSPESIEEYLSGRAPLFWEKIGGAK